MSWKDKEGDFSVMVYKNHSYKNGLIQAPKETKLKPTKDRVIGYLLYFLTCTFIPRINTYYLMCIFNYIIKIKQLHLRKGWIPYPPAMGWIVLLLVFYNDGFGIKWLTKVDMPLNKEGGVLVV